MGVGIIIHIDRHPLGETLAQSGTDFFFVLSAGIVALTDSIVSRSDGARGVGVEEK